MVINLIPLISLIWLHFVADFILQSDSVAKGKSKSNNVLAYHVAIYTLPFLLFDPVFGLVNGFLHFITDYCTSRATSYLWQKNERHWFFVVIGLDQAIHMTCLVLTYVWLVQ